MDAKSFEYPKLFECLDIPVLGDVREAEGNRVPENIVVLEHFRVFERKKLKLPDPTQKNVLPTHL